MIQRTHDLAAVALVSYYFLTYSPPSLNWETLLGIGVATFIGGIIPDIDNVASPAWEHKLTPWEGKASRDFLDGHRHLSHSLLGIFLFTWVLGLLLNTIKLPHLEVGLVQLAFFLGQLSHLIADTVTIEGVPWFYPIPFKIGIPPFKFMRIRTGGWVEKLIVFPLLLAFTIWIYYSHHEVIGKFLKI